MFKTVTSGKFFKQVLLFHCSKNTFKSYDSNTKKYCKQSIFSSVVSSKDLNSKKPLEFKKSKMLEVSKKSTLHLIAAKFDRLA